MESVSAKSPHSPIASGPSVQDRRGFLAKSITVLFGVAALAGPVAAGVVAWVNPLRQKGQAGGLFRLTSLDVLPEDGTPRRFAVMADRTDAWSRFPNEAIGAVFLRRTGDSNHPVEALSAVCPHAGCFVGYDAQDRRFLCPCHLATFNLDGERLQKGSQSPRNMDSLQVELRDGAQIWVKFENFRTGIPEKVVET